MPWIDGNDNVYVSFNFDHFFWSYLIVAPVVVASPVVVVVVAPPVVVVGPWVVVGALPVVLVVAVRRPGTGPPSGH